MYYFGHATRNIIWKARDVIPIDIIPIVLFPDWRQNVDNMSEFFKRFVAIPVS